MYLDCTLHWSGELYRILLSEIVLKSAWGARLGLGTGWLLLSRWDCCVWSSACYSLAFCCNVLCTFSFFDIFLLCFAVWIPELKECVIYASGCVELEQFKQTKALSVSGMCQDLYRNIQVKFVSIDCQDHSEVLVGIQTYISYISYIYIWQAFAIFAWFDHICSVFRTLQQYFNSILTVSTHLVSSIRCLVWATVKPFSRRFFLCLTVSHAFLIRSNEFYLCDTNQCFLCRCLICKRMCLLKVCLLSLLFCKRSSQFVRATSCLEHCFAVPSSFHLRNRSGVTWQAQLLHEVMNGWTKSMTQYDIHWNL
jgi:hypothetical protein